MHPVLLCVHVPQSAILQVPCCLLVQGEPASQASHPTEKFLNGRKAVNSRDPERRERRVGKRSRNSMETVFRNAVTTKRGPRGSAARPEAAGRPPEPSFRYVSTAKDSLQALLGHLAYHFLPTVLISSS